MISPGTIEIRVEQFKQLFNSMDPSPFRERDLDDSTEEYIVSWAREMPSRQPIEIVVHLPQAEARAAEQHGIETAFQHYFRSSCRRAPPLSRCWLPIKSCGIRRVLWSLEILSIRTRGISRHRVVKCGDNRSCSILHSAFLAERPNPTARRPNRSLIRSMAFINPSLWFV